MLGQAQSCVSSVSSAFKMRSSTSSWILSRSFRLIRSWRSRAMHCGAPIATRHISRYEDFEPPGTEVLCRITLCSLRDIDGHPRSLRDVDGLSRIDSISCFYVILFYIFLAVLLNV